MTFICSTCFKRHSREGQRKCHKCHANDQRWYRTNKRITDRARKEEALEILETIQTLRGQDPSLAPLRKRVLEQCLEGPTSTSTSWRT